MSVGHVLAWLLSVALAPVSLAAQEAAPTPVPSPHAQHQHPPASDPAPPPSPAAHEHDDMSRDEPPLPPITEADRAAAFPDVGGHAVHDRAVHYSVLFDQFEWQGGSDAGAAWDTTNWIGGDVQRLWVRSEGDVEGERLETADAHLLYGRAISPWWDLVAGVRQDFGPGPSRTWAAVGLQGLAPYWFEVQATAYLGAEGRTHARLEVEYELLFTNRLVLQPLVEVELYGKDDPERRIGAGLSTLELGARLRYEFRRELAPYVGVTWERAFGDTADFAAADGDPTSRTRFLGGVRVWF